MVAYTFFVLTIKPYFKLQTTFVNNKDIINSSTTRRNLHIEYVGQQDHQLEKEKIKLVF